MSSVRRIICLANSRKHGAYCVAGIDTATKKWIRPVTDLDDGRVERSTMLVDGRAPALGDIVEIPLASGGPDFGFECENLSILPGAWRIREAIDPRGLIPYCSSDRFILHNSENFVTAQYLQGLPFEQRHTLQLVEAFQFEVFNRGLSAQGGHKWTGSFISQHGERLTARITDPVLAEKLEQGYIPGFHCVITVSLSMPFRTEEWESDQEPCWKLIAGVVELEQGVWPEKKTDTAKTAGHSRTHEGAGVSDDTAVMASLKNVFGFEAFKPNQREIVRAILDGRDCLAVMPTGGGKSLCFQLPASLQSGTCMVISPLISLMKDQVDAAVSIGLHAACLSSVQTEAERIRVFRLLAAGRLDLLYVSPERFAMEAFLNTIRRIRLCLIAVDEAHCISEWGHDFRPDYLYLAHLTEFFPGVPIAAFTATATHRVGLDIINQLRLRDPFVVRASFNRPNLFYEVIPKDEVESQIVDFIRAHPQQSGIVYRTTRRSVESTVEVLDAAGIKALPYHAGLEDRVRQANQEAFNRDEVDVVVATIAFGMGIDKPNVRFVLHGDLSKNMEAYYQETGRAGRDGEPARCVLFFGRGDIPKIRYFIDQVEDQAERLRQRASLNEMVLYASSTAACRRRKILGYFGEEFGERSCETCDVCTRALQRVDITRQAQMVLSAVSRTGQRFGAGHIIDIVCGANTKKIRELRHEELPTYGVGKDQPKSFWREIIDDLMAEHIISQSDGQYPVIKLGRSAPEILRGEKPVQVKRITAAPQPRLPAQIAPEDPRLFERLRLVRLQFAHENNVPSFVIFPDRTLHEMASHRPADEQAMRAIYGIGETKLAAYGAAFLREIASFEGRELRPACDTKLPAATGPAVPRKTGCGTTVEATWSLLKLGLSLKETARRRGLQITTIVDHVESLIRSGREIDIDTFVPVEVRDHIARMLPHLKTGLLREIVDSAKIPVTFEQAKLAKAWIQSAESRQQPAKP